MKVQYAKFLVLAAALAAVIVAGCVSEAPAKLIPISARLDEPFKLGIGQAAEIRLESIRISAINVTSDSRCPSDVQCIQAGEATVLVDVAKNGKSLAMLNMTTAGAAPKFVDGYSITLATVEPYPKSTQRIQPSEYAVTLVVSKEILGALSRQQQQTVGASLATLIELKTKGGISPDSEASGILSGRAVAVTIEFKEELSRAEIQSLEASGIEFARMGGEVSHTGRFYNAGIAWGRMFEALEKLTSMPEAVKVDSAWQPLFVPPLS